MNIYIYSKTENHNYNYTRRIEYRSNDVPRVITNEHFIACSDQLVIGNGAIDEEELIDLVK